MSWSICSGLTVTRVADGQALVLADTGFGVHLHIPREAEVGLRVEAIQKLLHLVVQLEAADGMQLGVLERLLDGLVDQVIDGTGHDALAAHLAYHQVAGSFALAKSGDLDIPLQLAQGFFVGALNLVGFYHDLEANPAARTFFLCDLHRK